MAIAIRGRGSPIKTNPVDTIYVVTIWDIQRDYRSDCNISILHDEQPVCELVLDTAVHHSDLDHSNKDILEKYYNKLHPQHITESNYSFKGKKGRSAYILDICNRITSIIRTPERETTNINDNAHISQRKKGHSHQRKKAQSL